VSAHGPMDPVPGAPVARPGVGVDQALAGLRVGGPGARAGLDRLRLGPAAAGALRAALDTLLGDERAATAQVMADESALEVRCTRIDPQGLLAAGGVLETVEGNVGPTPGVPGSWSVRLPVLGPRETFLMFECGDVPLALPWHSVARVRMTPREALIEIALHEGVPVISPFGLPVDTVSDGPAILVGIGLRRAYVLADRLVWRLTATPVDPMMTPPEPRMGPALTAGDDRVFWLLDPAEVLREVPLPLGTRPARSRVPPPEESVVRPQDSANATTPLPARDVATSPIAAPADRAHPPLRLIELTRDEVEPLGSEDAGPDWLFGSWPETTSAEPASDDASEPAQTTDAMSDLLVAPPGPEPAPVAEPAVEEPAPAPAPRALIAEDSITACIFLERLLEQRGFAVLTVGSARDLRTTLTRERWDLVFADVDLPDAPGGSGLVGLSPRRLDGAGAPIVALVRDREDSAIARAAGVSHVLRKPFEYADVDHVLASLGLAGPRARS
jgi:CheY-like chemotaxis protein